MFQAWTLQPGDAVTTTNSIFGAASVADGSLLWEVAVPGANMSRVVLIVVGNLLITGVTREFGFTLERPGIIVALNMATGRTVFEYGLDGPFRGVLSVQDEYLFAGPNTRADPAATFGCLKCHRRRNVFVGHSGSCCFLSLGFP